MAPCKLTVVVALVASLLLLCNSNTKVTTERRVDARQLVCASGHEERFLLSRLFFFPFFSGVLNSFSWDCFRQAAPPPAPALGPPPHQIADPAKGICEPVDSSCDVWLLRTLASLCCIHTRTDCGAARTRARTCAAGRASSAAASAAACTAGNRETCGKCYTDWTTHGNKTKCP
jgi:hypothetical protein